MAKVQCVREIADQCGVSLSTAYRAMRGDVRNPRLRNALVNAGLAASDRPTEGPYLLVGYGQMSSHALEFYNLVQKSCAGQNIELGFTLDTTLRLELARRNYTGILALAPIEDFGLPTVYLNLRDLRQKFSGVYLDRFAGHLKLFTLLAARGLRRIGLFGSQGNAAAYYFKHGPLDEKLLYDYSELPFDPDLICRVPITRASHIESCRRAADYFCNLAPRPEAIVLFDDIYACRLVARLRENGLRIPEDIVVASLGDSLCHPPTTPNYDSANIEDMEMRPNLPIICGHLPLADMAAAAMELLRNHISAPRFHAREIAFTVDLDGLQYLTGEKK